MAVSRRKRTSSRGPVRNGRPWAVALVALLLTGANTCDDAAKVVARNADALDVAVKYQDEVARALAQAEAAAQRAATRVNAAADSIETSTAEVREAVWSIAWEATCDVVTGSIPTTQEEITEWLLENAARFGLEFVGEGADVLGEAILDAIGTDGEESDAAAACSEVGDLEL